MGLKDYIRRASAGRFGGGGLSSRPGTGIKGVRQQHPALGQHSKHRQVVFISTNLILMPRAAFLHDAHMVSGFALDVIIGLKDQW